MLLKVNKNKELYSQIDPKYHSLVLRNSWYKTKKGYLRGWVDGRCQYLHKFLLETHLGRPLKEGMTTDHINEDKLDNRIENLQEIDRASNFRKTHIGKPRSKEIKRKLSRYGLVPVVNLDTGAIYESLTSCAKELNTTKSMVWRIVSGKTKRIKKYNLCYEQVVKL
jgi:hypothetical protein